MVYVFGASLHQRPSHFVDHFERLSEPSPYQLRRASFAASASFSVEGRIVERGSIVQRRGFEPH